MYMLVIVMYNVMYKDVIEKLEYFLLSYWLDLLEELKG